LQSFCTLEKNIVADYVPFHLIVSVRGSAIKDKEVRLFVNGRKRPLSKRGDISQPPRDNNDLAPLWDNSEFQRVILGASPLGLTRDVGGEMFRAIRFHGYYMAEDAASKLYDYIGSDASFVEASAWRKGTNATLANIDTLVTHCAEALGEYFEAHNLTVQDWYDYAARDTLTFDQSANGVTAMAEYYRNVGLWDGVHLNC
jgi:hypothetical protein